MPIFFAHNDANTFPYICIHRPTSNTPGQTKHTQTSLSTHRPTSYVLNFLHQSTITIISGVEPNHLQELSRIVGNKKKDNVVPQTITSDMFNEYFSNIG